MKVRDSLPLEFEDIIIRDGRVDWRSSFPRQDGESNEEWARRLKNTRCRYEYYLEKMDPERNRALNYKRNSWKRRNKDKARKYAKTTYQERRGLVLWRAARERAKKGDLEFSIDWHDIQAVIDDGRCEITGLPFDMSAQKGPFSPSIEKIDPMGGYTPNNTVVVCWGFNAAKNRFEMEDVIKIAEAVVRNKKLLLRLSRGLGLLVA